MAEVECEVLSLAAEQGGPADDLGVADEQADWGVSPSEGREAVDGVYGVGGEFAERCVAVDGDRGDEVIGREPLVGDGNEGVGEGVEVIGAEFEPGGHVVPAVADQVFVAASQGVMEAETFDGTCGACEGVVGAAEEDNGACEALDEA